MTDETENALVKAYGIHDKGTDILGGGRGTQAFIGPTTSVPVTHQDYRGWGVAKLNLFGLESASDIVIRLSHAALLESRRVAPSVV